MSAQDVLAGRARWAVEQGDALAVLAGLPDGCVQCCVTSPPFWGLRDYKLPPTTWGDGWLGCLGLEPTPAQYVAHVVEVFREVRRVLHPTGTCWGNWGDSYAGGGNGARDPVRWPKQSRNADGFRSEHAKKDRGLKNKDLVGIPWRVAFALQEDGWWLRSDIVWAKTACMPESVTDRPTSSHEHVFLLAKAARYYYDADAVREPDAGQDHRRSVVEPVYDVMPGAGPHHGIRTTDGRNGSGRNLRNVWTLGPEPLKSDHYAAWPTAIPRRAILAGTSERGVCPACGNPWRRVTERVGPSRRDVFKERGGAGYVAAHANPQALNHAGHRGDLLAPPRMLGWEPTCTHGRDPVPALVLDPFSGSGRTVLTALNLGRRAIGVELSSYQCDKSRDRIVGDKPLFNRPDAEAAG